jgi:hypothetical protein
MGAVVKDRDLKDAFDMAAAAAAVDEACPTIDRYGQRRYTVQQGLRNAHAAREDSAATLIYLSKVLPRIEFGVFVCACMLALVLWRVW